MQISRLMESLGFHNVVDINAILKTDNSHKSLGKKNEPLILRGLQNLMEEMI